MGKGNFTKTAYVINKDGTIFSTRLGRDLKFSHNSKGYRRVKLYDRTVAVHRAVAEKFIPNPDNKPQIHHINGDKLDNRADNLEWVTNQENADRGLELGEYRGRNNHRLSIDDASEACEAYDTGLYTHQEIADGYGVHRSTIQYATSQARRI